MRFALVGDIHGCWDELDNAYFDQSAADCVLFTGDLAVFTGNRTFRIAEVIARLTKPYALIAGNHDCVTMPAFLGEITGQDLLANLAAGRIAKRYRRLQKLLGPRLVGYSAVDAGAYRVVGARPLAMDGAKISFRETIRRLFGVADAAASAERLGRLLAEGDKPAVVLAHNGPRGLGSRPADMFGVDFRPGGGDHGDADLAAALAASAGRVALVVAGHMHHAVRGAPEGRTVWARLGETWVVNAARVPRHTDEGGFYLEATLENGAFKLEEVTYRRRPPFAETRRLLVDSGATPARPVADRGA